MRILTTPNLVVVTIEMLESKLLFTSFNFAALNARGTLTLTGTSGNDVMSVRKQGDRIVAFRNGDEVTFSAQRVKRVRIDGMDGDDSLAMKVKRRATLDGGAGDDDLGGSEAPDTFCGGTGTNRFGARGGDDLFDYSDTPLQFLEDFEVYSASVDGPLSGELPQIQRRYIDGDFPSGSDFFAWVPGITVRFTEADDRIIAFMNDFPVAIDGAGGADKISLGAHPESSAPIKGRRVLGGAGDDSIICDDGNNLMIGGEGNDTLIGGDGDDTLFGGSGKDKLSGNDGDDVFAAGDGLRDTLDGGDGNDAASDDVGIDSVKNIETFI